MKKTNPYIPHYKLFTFTATDKEIKANIKKYRFEIAKMDDSELYDLIMWILHKHTLSYKTYEQLHKRLAEIATRWVYLYKQNGNYYVLPNRYLCHLIRRIHKQQGVSVTPTIP